MKDFFARVDEIRSSAAQFYAVDLHLHSPSSYDWDNSPEEGQPRDPSLDRIQAGESVPDHVTAAYRTAISSSKRDLVAITDHNVSTFGEAAAARNSEPGPHVLPGIELSVAFSNAPLIRDIRIHVLAIFPEDTHHGAFARILPPGTPAEDTRDLRRALVYSSVDQLIDCIHSERGLAIGAHVESTMGLRGAYRNTAELMLEPSTGSPAAQQILKSLGDHVKDELVKFDAIQVTPVTAAVHYTSPKGELRVPLIVGSDCHKGQELGQDQSAKYSYVKMARPSFAALRDALKFPDVRVRLKAGLPKAQPPRLLGLRIAGHKVTAQTFFNDTTLGFSDNLTCLIGPRGSGKSAVIDSLRYLMGYNRTLEQIDTVAGQVIDRQKNTLERSRIEVSYQAAGGQVYRLVATYDPREDYVTEVYDCSGAKLNIEDVETCGEFPLTLFGWGELELLAQSPDAQRELLDRFIPDVCRLKEARKEILFGLSENRRSCREQAEQMDGYFTDPSLDFQRLNEYKAQFEELNTDEIQELFSQLDDLKAKRKVLGNIEEQLRQRVEAGDIAPALGIGEFLEGEHIREWADSFTARLKPEALDDWMREVSHEHHSRVEVARGIVRAEDVRLSRQEENAEKQIQSVIGEEQAITGDLRNRAKARYETAQRNYEEYKALNSHLEMLLDKRKAMLRKVEDYDNRIFASRHQEISRIRREVSLVEDEQYRIDLVLKQREDRSALLACLAEGALNLPGHWRATKRPEILAENLTPRSLADILISKDVAALDGLSVKIDGTDYTLKRADAERIASDNTPYEEVAELETARVDPAQLDAVLHIQELPIDDAFFITLGGKPIQHCSPGQRCSAMLPVVALTSQAPLVIDQPEDNLDNRLVSRALFKILARLKETRQIIFATHNPNILVSGDAEQVLLLSPEGDLESHGCIDDPDIIASVIELMEGGTEAFRRREKKYGPYL